MDRRNTIALLETAELRFKVADYPSALRYYDTYRSAIRQQSSRGLWLGLRIARETGDRDAEGSYALALRNLYPESTEYEAYQRSNSDD
jgi:type IV pilus assembly protein PilF